MILQAIRGIEELYVKNKNIEILAENFSGVLYFHLVLAKYLFYMLAEEEVRK